MTPVSTRTFTLSPSSPLVTPGLTVNLDESLRRGEMLWIRDAGREGSEAEDVMIILTGMIRRVNDGELITNVLFARRGSLPLGLDPNNPIRLGTVQRQITVGEPFELYNRVPLMNRFSSNGARPDITISSVLWAEVGW